MPEQTRLQLRLSVPREGATNGLVRRPHLDESLSKGITQPVTLVCAGPGWGKTSTVASWVHRGAPSITAWLTIDPADNFLSTFWSDVLGALTVSGAIPPDSPLQEFSPTSGFGDPEIQQICAGIADLPKPVVLVLDDFHNVTSDAVLESVATLIDDEQISLHLVLVTRSDPKLRLHRLRMSGDLAEIRSRDLAFTPSEAAILFERAGISLTEDQLAVLLEHTQGWPAGLRLATMSLRADNIESGIYRFSGTDSSVAEYLIVEVIDRLPPEDRDFLLKTSIAERIHPDLATALTGRHDSRLLLEQLKDTNAFVVSLGAQHEWFSYHPLLRDLLQHRLALEQPDNLRRLHLQAAHWFTTTDEPIEGIRHASQAKAWNEVGRILTSASLLVLTPAGPALVDALEPAAAQARTQPGLYRLLAAGVCHYVRHDFEMMQRDTTEAAEFLSDAPEDALPATEVLIAALQMAYTRTRNPRAIVSAASRLLALLDAAPRRRVPAGRHYRALGDNNLGVGLLWSGDFTAARTTLSAAEFESRELGLELTELNAQLHLALLDVFHGRLLTAHREANTAQHRLDRRGWGSQLGAVAGYLTLGLTHLARNELDQAQAQIDRGLGVSSHPDRAAQLALDIAAIEVAAARGDIDALRAAAARLRAECDQAGDIPDMLARWTGVAQADAHLALGAPEAALERIEPGQDRDGFAGALERVVLARAHLAMDQPQLVASLLDPLLASPTFRVQTIEALILTAVASGQLHQTTAALDAFTKAVDLAEPDGIIRPFVTAWSPVSALLTQHRRVVGRHLDFTHDIASAITPEPERESAQPTMVEHFTDRELLVLRYLPTMLKASEIAADLFLSVHTVKTHLRSIYRKLDVTTRKDAVDRARDLNLI